jgi:hypothetical protein
VAALVAVAVTFASQHKASAQCGWYWKGNIGVNFSWDAVMGTLGSQGPCHAYGCPPPAYGYAPAYAGNYAPAPYAYNYAPPVNYQAYAAPYYGTPAPAQQPAAPAVAQQPTMTQIGYYPYAYNYYGYQAPSYWYGR